MAQTVIGFFDNATEAQRAVEKLTSIGISRDMIDVSNNTTGTAGVADTRSTDRSDRDSDDNGITRFFKSLFGGDDDEADRYSRVAERSGAIVTVHARTEDEAERAADLLDDCGAVDVDERAAQYGYTAGRSGSETDRRGDISNERGTTIPRIEENLEVGKRTVERGGVRVRSRIVERPVEEHVRLREENIHVEREAVNRPIAGDELSNFQERNIELTERAEVPVVNKEARVVEEVRVSKDVNERDEVIRDTVRNTDVDVQKTDRNETRDRDTRTNKDNPRSI
jgi:stress response protein YsnF